MDLITEIYRRLYEAYGPQSWWPAETWFEVVVGAVLTQNTAWKNVERAIENLKRAGLLEPRKLYETNDEFVEMLIKPAGFWKLKARRLKNLLQKLAEHDFDFYRLRESLTRDELLSVAGIGPETADSILLYAFEQPVFVVDNYTRRIFTRVGVLNGKENYSQIQSMFQRAVKDIETMKEYHALLVEHAKKVCKKREPRCDSCALKDLCQTWNKVRSETAV
ncbi:endonuclease III domain-containing protein [Pseudothermotoga sp.]|uniref:endonuclease III domain-containing protein n=1 Tax=Pseudothermotoga sp. TaxID=2033661 RepID=UPI000AE64ACF